eukprot:CAMPEP_0182462054 /NCGR_PEP_ID=MMETSP1319-20130603/6451_1 /TAXON_ID=172717 /ORGANISM="Bolidomonas pacifica, Strain RCC208" /LENGTH=250 /DNA_ID=CAMNT_0024661431 /DNA_START=466 /DNA_END=1218 /DNA_ORIENTATION=-
MHSYSANSSSVPLNNNDAFRTLETETSTDRDNFAVLERKFAKDKVTNDSTGLYAGAAGYSTFSSTNQAQVKASKYTGSRGQLRANTTIRTTSRMDYAPDVCKDYRLTGSCGFGDTCIFLHDRTDSKSAQEVESEWEARKKRAQEERDRAVRELEGEAEDGGKPEYKYGFGCMVCKSHFKDPVETPCGHVFCSSCLDLSGPCPQCGKEVGGVSKQPTGLIKERRRHGAETWEEYYRERLKEREEEKDDENV